MWALFEKTGGKYWICLNTELILNKYGNNDYKWESFFKINFDSVKITANKNLEVEGEGIWKQV